MFDAICVDVLAEAVSAGYWFEVVKLIIKIYFKTTIYVGVLSELVRRSYDCLDFLW